MSTIGHNQTVVGHMENLRKIVLHCPTGYRLELGALVTKWMQSGVRYVGVVGKDASRIEEIIDELCVGDGSAPYDMLTAFHESPETIDDAIALAALITEDYGRTVEVVVL